jgi:S1-C subfamily serine protease
MKNLQKFIIILIVGAVGGIFSTQILWPYFVEKPLMEKYKIKEAPTYVVQKEEIYIQENVALVQAIEKVEKSVVGIGTETSGGQKFLKGSGLVLTNDGLIITLSSLVSSDSKVFYDGETIPTEILKRDSQGNLVLLKVEKENLPVCRFADLKKTKIGERVFLLGEKYDEDANAFIKFTNEGIIKSFDESLVETNLSEGKFAPGTALFNIEGEMVGLNYLSAEGEILAIPIQKIREFSGF